jgi:hypothetical protein
MENLSIDLNLPCKVLQDSFNPKHYFESHQTVPVNVCLHQTLLDFLKLYNIYVTSVELFYRRPNPNYGIVHVDNEGYTDRLNINWIVGGDDSVMSWFNPINNNPGYVTVGDTGSTPRRWDFKDVELIHSAEIKQPSLIQSAVPHAILNTKKQRWCVCANIRDIKTQSVITMAMAQDRLRNYIT